MSERSTTCPACKGVISIPSRRRNLTLEQVVTNHNETCPSQPRRIKDANS